MPQSERTKVIKEYNEEDEGQRIYLDIYIIGWWNSMWMLIGLRDSGPIAMVKWFKRLDKISHYHLPIMVPTVGIFDENSYMKISW